MTQDKIIELAIQGHAGTRDAIRWAMNQAIKEALAQPERYMKVEGPLHVVCQCDKCKAQPEQEPWPEEPEGHIAGGVHPPQRTWVGLTDEEKLVANQMWRVMDADGFIKAIEAKLKEKNTWM